MTTDPLLPPMPSSASRPTTKNLLLYHKLSLLTKPNAKTLAVGCRIHDLIDYLDEKPHQHLTGLNLAGHGTVHSITYKNNNVSILDGSPAHLVPPTQYDTILLPNSLPEHYDAQQLLADLEPWAHPRTKLIIAHQNNLWEPLLKKSHNAWVSPQDVKTLCELTQWEVFKTDGCSLIPARLLFADLINQWVAPCLPPLQQFAISFCRKKSPRKAEMISIIIPVRNEAGNIPFTLDKIPNLNRPTEVLFVEGNSKDNTWQALLNLPPTHKGRDLHILKQPGIGKGDAVRHGFAHAQGDLLIILDGDLTMPPEELPKYVRALEDGITDFANGSRLVYTMEKTAMQTANLIANKAFGLAFSSVLKQPIKDTLCGTKCLWKEDYEEIACNRSYFGDLDPFGDFDLLLGASHLNLKILDIPIHYKERIYGETNIQRWKHGVLLAKMLWLAARKLQFHSSRPLDKYPQS